MLLNVVCFLSLGVCGSIVSLCSGCVGCCAFCLICCCCCMPFSTILVVNPGSPGLESSVLVSS